MGMSSFAIGVNAVGWAASAAYRSWSTPPRRPADIRCPPTDPHKCAGARTAFREHDHGPRITNDGRQTGVFGSEGPHEHPVRTDRNQRAAVIEGIGVAVLHSAVEHIDQSRRRIGGPW